MEAEFADLLKRARSSSLPSTRSAEVFGGSSFRFPQFADSMPPFAPNSSPLPAAKTQAKLTSVSGVKIAGASMALGSNFLANEDLADQVGGN